MTGTAVELHQERTAALELTGSQVAFTKSQVAILRSLGMDQATPEDFGALLHFSQRHNLDPFAKQVTLIPFWSKGSQRYATHITIDGYLSLASRTGRFIGIDGPYFCNAQGEWDDVWLSDEPPAAARIVLRYYDRFGVEQRTNGTVTYRDRVQRKKDGGLMPMWASMPTEMLANAALRLAIRRGLPEALDGLADDVAAEYDRVEGEQVPVQRATVKALHTPNRTDPADPFGLEREDAGVAPVPSETVVVEMEAPGVGDEPMATGNLVRRIKILQRDLGIDDAAYRKTLMDNYGVASSKDLAAWQAREVIARMQARLDKVRAEAATPAEQQAAPESSDADVQDAEVIDEVDEFAIDEVQS